MPQSAQSEKKSRAKLDRVIKGSHVFDSFHVAPNERLVIDGDLDISTQGSIVIEGPVIVVDGDRPGAAAPKVSLTSKKYIRIDSELTGGRGSNGDSSSGFGAQGTSVILTAPVVFGKGVVRGGRGGNGVLGTKGGNGGDVAVRAVLAIGLKIVGGEGGNGGEGLPGSEGGRAEKGEMPLLNHRSIST